MAESERLQGGELNAAVTSALVGIHNVHLGRGPRTASTFHHGNVIVTLMQDVMTPAERTLARTGNSAAVTNMRHLFQETMQTDFNEAVQRLSGRKVPAFISGNHADPDMAAEVFVLDSHAREGGAGAALRDGCEPDETGPARLVESRPPKGGL
jgi:uncharacterized protein YbcI